jgi:hypothetical protein
MLVVSASLQPRLGRYLVLCTSLSTFAPYSAKALDPRTSFADYVVTRGPTGTGCGRPSFARLFKPLMDTSGADIGALITAGSSRELFHLASIQQLRVYTSVAEVDAAAVRNGERVSLTQEDAYPGQIFSGTIVRNSNAIDQATRR